MFAKLGDKIRFTWIDRRIRVGVVVGHAEYMAHKYCLVKLRQSENPIACFEKNFIEIVK